MSSVIKWVVAGVGVAVPAAALAYVGGPIADVGLAVLAVAVAFALVARHDRQISGLRRTATKSVRSLERLREQNDRLRESLKAMRAENAALKVQLAKAQTALDKKIALAVQRMHEKFKAELAALEAGIRDSEVESGLDALNRYIALATQPANVVGEDDASPQHTAT